MKVDLKLEDFLTLIGPAQYVYIMDEEGDQEEGEILYKGVVAKARNNVDMERLIKFIIPEAKPNDTRQYMLKIYVY